MFNTTIPSKLSEHKHLGLILASDLPIVTNILIKITSKDTRTNKFNSTHTTPEHTEIYIYIYTYIHSFSETVITVCSAIITT